MRIELLVTCFTLATIITFATLSFSIQRMILGFTINKSRNLQFWSKNHFY